MYTDVNVCVPLPLWYAFRSSGGNTDSMYLRGCNATFFFVPISFPLKQWMQQLESVFFFFFYFGRSFQTSHSLRRMHFLYLYISSTASQGLLSHQPLCHRCSEYQVKKKHLPSHFLKICVQSTDIFKHRRIYKSIYILCHRYNVKYDVFYAKVFAVPPPSSLCRCRVFSSWTARRQVTTAAITDSWLTVFSGYPSSGDVLHVEKAHDWFDWTG